jgi:5'-3' exonuclease
MIYHCLQRNNTETYPESANTDEMVRKAWENKFIYSVENYLERVVKLVKPTEGIFVGVDGVVPLAKMRQQRQRRFKAAWEKTRQGRADTWDKNAITPGTDFMKRLCRHLAESKKFPGKKYVFSGVDEAGEGEHKVMDAWRRAGASNNVPKNNALYGLDADLIVLSMLNRKCVGNVWLFREEVKEGQILRATDGEEKFVWFDIQFLEKSLATRRRWLENYLFAMTVLGNDFLPTGFSMKLREDGHDRLCEVLNEIGAKDIGARGLLRLFRNLAEDEEERVQKFIARKISQGDSIGVETGLGERNWPLVRVWEDEGLLMEDHRLLRSDWQDRYHRLYFHGADRDTVCREYVRGLYWTWNYYRGVAQEDRWTWFYPWHMPPLWCWLVKYLETYEYSQIITTASRLQCRTPQPQPIEQLTLVLPMESWWLIQCPVHQTFPTKAPWYFPEKYSFFSHGRRFFWECEADIPIPTIQEIRETVADKLILPQ